MNNLKKLKDNIKFEIDKFTIANSNTMDCIIDCQPYEELEYCETVEEVKDWLENYQLNIDDAKQEFQDFNDILENLSSELLKGE